MASSLLYCSICGAKFGLHGRARSNLEGSAPQTLRSGARERLVDCTRMQYTHFSTRLKLSGTSVGMPTARRACAARSALQELTRDVSLVVERAARNTRRLYAGVVIRTPREVVWEALTSYEALADFIPGLAENRCLEKRPGGAQLLQVGEQSIALGAKFRATVVLDIQEYKQGVPEKLCFRSGTEESGEKSRRRLFPEPRSDSVCSPPQDIAFSMIKGDFTAFRGIWRMQEAGPGQTFLSYSLHVQPQPWLPVRLIQSRIEGEVKTNLRAVRDHSERQWRTTQGS